MRSRRLVLLAVPVAALLGLAFWLSWQQSPPPPSAIERTTAPADTPAASAPSQIAGSTIAPRAGVPTAPSIKPGSAAPSAVPAAPAAPATPAATPVLPPDEAAMIEVDKVSLMIRDYRTMAGENPVGTNAEIMAAVMGGNPREAKLGPPAGMELNEKGELIDRWNTPYFFHQLSRDHMEIRSAGADKVMWTEDDPVIK